MEFKIRADETVSMAVVRAVSERTDKDSLALSPLAAVIDTDALDVLFETPQKESTRGSRTLSFWYHDCRITVVDGASIQVESASETVESAPQITE